MTDKEGILQRQPSGRWAVCRPEHAPVEITSGEVFRIEVDGELRPTRMEFRHFTGPLKGRELMGHTGRILFDRRLLASQWRARRDRRGGLGR
jgi:hypothetical protein